MKHSKQPILKAYTFASRTSLDTNQSLQKSMLSPALKKTKNLPPQIKIKLCRHSTRQIEKE